MAATKNSPAAMQGDREIVVTRVFDAPRDLVFELWIDPKHIAHWWGPAGFTTTTYKMDVRPGGIWRFIMHGPDGVDYPNRIDYLEVKRPERLVYHHGGDQENDPGRSLVTVTFAEQNGKTKLTIHMLFPTAEQRTLVVEHFHAIDGSNQTLDRLEEELEKVAIHPELVLTRVLDAPRAAVFHAWTDSGQLRRWWGPKDFTNPVCELDPRPGGVIRIHMRGPDGVVYPMTGVVREIAPPEKLVFTSIPLDANGDALFEVLNTITFEENNGKTKLTVRAHVVRTTAAAAMYLAGMEQGWMQSLDRLDREVVS